MRIRTDQPRDGERDCGSREREVPVPITTASADLVRPLLAALRAAARKNANLAVEAAAQALEARVHDPYDAALDASHPADGRYDADLDDKVTSDREDAWSLTRPLVLRSGLAPRSPEARILAEWRDQLFPPPPPDAEHAEADAEPKEEAERATEHGLHLGKPAPERKQVHERVPRDRHGHTDPGDARHETRVRKDWRQEPPPGVKSSDALKHAEELRRARAGLEDGPKLQPGTAPPARKPAPTPKPEPPKPIAKPPPEAKVTPAGPSAGDAAVAAWQDRQVKKVEKLEAPPVPDADRYVTTYRAATTKARELTDSEKLRLIESAEKAVKPVDQPEDAPKYPDPDEFAEAHKLVQAKTNQKLPEQTLPSLEPTPLGNLPEVGMYLRRDQADQLHIMKETVDSKGKSTTVEVKIVADTAKKTKDDKVLEIRTPKPSQLQKGVDALKELQEKGKKKGIELKAKGLPKGITISDDRRLGPPAVPKFAQVDIGTIIAKVFVLEATYADQIVEEARAAFAKGTLDPGDVSSFAAGEKTAVDGELRKIQKAAKITDEQLKTKTDAEEAKLKADVKAKNDQKEEAAVAAKDALAQKGKTLGLDIEDLADGLVRAIDDKEAMTKGGFERKEIEKKRDAAKEESDKRVEDWRGEYDRMGKRRVEQLQEAGGKEMRAYDAAAEIDRRQIDLQLGVKSPSARVANDPNYKPTDDWLTQIKKELGVDIGKLIAKARDTAKRFKEEVSEAGDQADTLIDKWAKDRFDKERSWWDRLIRAILEWLAPAKKSAKEWKTTNTEDNTTNLSNDMLWLQKARIAHWTELDEETIKSSKQFTEEQKAMLLSLKRGADAPTALAASLVSRLSQQHRPELHRQFEEKVMTFTDGMKVQKIGFGQGGQTEEHYAERRAKAIYLAGAGMTGTDEKTIFDSLTGLTKIQGRAVELVYEQVYPKRNLRDDLREEMYDVGEQAWGTTHDWDKSVALLEGNGAKAAAVDLQEAMHGGFLNLGAGTDEKVVWDTLKGKTPGEIAEIKRQYRAMTGRDLIVDVHGELDDGWSTPHDRERFDAIVAGDVERARAIEADSAMRGSSFFGIFSDRKGVESVFKDIKTEVEREAEEKGWDSERTKREIAARWAAFDKKYEEVYGGGISDESRAVDPITGKKDSALTTVMKQSFTWGSLHGAANLQTSTADLDILLSYQTVAQKADDPDIKSVFKHHIAEVSAGRVQAEHRGIFSSSDTEENEAIAEMYESAYRDRLRDGKLALQKQRDADFAAVQKQMDAKRTEASKIRDVKKRFAALAAIDKEQEQAEKPIRRKWAPEGQEFRSKMQQLHIDASGDAQRDAVENMAELRKTFDAKYKAWNQLYGGETKTFDEVVLSDTRWMGIGGYGGYAIGANQKTRALLAGSGYLSDEDKLYYSVKGGGTDEATAKAVFADRDSTEAKLILQRLGTRLQKEGEGNKTYASEEQRKAAAEKLAAEWVLDDFSGRELQDQAIAMMGVPHTPEEHVAVAEKRLAFERESGPSSWLGTLAILALPGGALYLGASALSGGGSFDAESLGFLEDQVTDLKAEAKKAKDLWDQGYRPGDAKYDEVMDRVAHMQEWVNTAVEVHRAQVDAMADVVTTAIQVIVGVVTLVVGIVLTPVTGGLSTAIAIAVIGSLITTALTMAAKAAIKGAAYGWEEAITDAVVGVVDAITAGLTAGMGGNMLTGGLGLTKEAASNMIEGLIRKTVSNFVMGSIQAAPGILIATLINDGSFMDALAGILQAGAMNVAVSAVTEPIVTHFQGIKAMRTRLSPKEFEAGYQQFLKDHPKATRSDFRAEVDKVLHAMRPNAFRDPAMQAQMRAELLTDMPGVQRAAMKDARIEVVGERDFTRVTGKPASEPVAVLIKDGIPVVTVRAGTDLQALGTQAAHIFQATADALSPRPKPTADAMARPRGASGPEPRAPHLGAPTEKVILEPYTGPSLESPMDISAKHPGAKVIATEASLHPAPHMVAEFERAGGTYVPDNKPGTIPVASVDEIKMKFPIPHERALQQDFIRRFEELKALHPDRPPAELLDQAMRNTVHQAESLTSYAPYALERLKPGGTMEVVFWERQIIGELGGVSQLNVLDTATGKMYRLELAELRMAARGDVAPRSGFGITGITNETQVHVATFRKVELESKLPRGARGPDVVGEVVGTHSRRPFFPERAGGPIRELDYSKIRFTEKAIDVVEAHVRRFDGGGEMELAMVERLRKISRGELEATDFDRAFYSHELRESVRYRIIEAGQGKPLDADAVAQIWNDAHTATLEDYRLFEKRPGGGRTLFHPEVTEKFEPKITGGRGPFDATEHPVLARGESLEPHVRSGMERELKSLNVSREELRGLSDQELVARYAAAQVEQAPKRIAEFRSRLDPIAQAELDSLQTATHLHLQPVDVQVAGRLQKALSTPVHLDPTLPVGEIRVRTVLGRVEIHVGPNASLGDVLGHIPTVGAIQRYQGAVGLVRKVVGAVGRVFGVGGPPLGTRAHESWLELQKLPNLIEGRRKLLLDPALDVTTRLRIEGEVVRIENQLRRSIAALGDYTTGRGYVAIEGSNVKTFAEFTAVAGQSLDPLDPATFPASVREKIQNSFVHDAASWSADAKKLPNPNGEYIYVVRDVESGTILKVGESSAGASALDARMGAYRRATDVELWGKPVQVELHEIQTTGKASTVETDLRAHLYREAGAKATQQFEWDNKVPHRAGVFEGPGTPGEIPKDYETVEIKSKTSDSVTFVNEQGEVETILNPGPNLASAESGSSIEIPRRELLGWRKDPTGVINGGKPYIARLSAKSGVRAVKTPSPTARLAALPPDERHAELRRLLMANRGRDAKETVLKVAKALKVDDESTVYKLLRDKDLPPPRLWPSDFTLKGTRE